MTNTQGAALVFWLGWLVVGAVLWRTRTEGYGLHAWIGRQYRLVRLGMRRQP